MVDLRNFQTVTVDATGKGTIGAGVRLGDMATSLYNNFQRALPHGTCPGIGFGGHATRKSVVIIGALQSSLPLMET